MRTQDRPITSATMDAIIRHVFASCRSALHDKEFVPGLFLITEVAIREGVEKERNRVFELLLRRNAQ